MDILVIFGYMCMYIMTILDILSEVKYNKLIFSVTF